MNQKVFVSFGQNHEDVLLVRLFGQEKGTYIDVGACYPVISSVTKAFYDRGWRGINIEPQLDVFQVLCDDRPEDINLNIAISNEESYRTLYSSPECLPGATLHTEVAEDIKTMGGSISCHEVQTRTLGSVLREHMPDDWLPIGFLKVDVEGHEQEVLEGMCWDEMRPRIVVIEALRPNRYQPSHKSWEHILIKEGYECVAFDGLNRYYASSDDDAARRAFYSPVCIFDDYVDYKHIQIIGWIEKYLHEHMHEATETDSFKLLAQLLATMRESPYMLNFTPSQLDLALAKLVTRNSAKN